MADSPYVAKRVQAGIPIWDILACGRVIGYATVFDYEDEGPMATVRYGYNDDPVTFQGDSIRGVLAEVGLHLRAVDADMNAQADAEHYAEVIAPMVAAEREMERLYIPELDDEPVW